MTLRGGQVPSTVFPCRLGEIGDTSDGLRYWDNFAQEMEPVPPLGSTPLHHAKTGPVAEALLEARADVNARDKV